MTIQIAPSSWANIEVLQQRLLRLEGFLKDDNGNLMLLKDAFETAMKCGEWDRAQFHLTHAAALSPDDLEWKLREGDFWLGRGEFERAGHVLTALLHIPNPTAEFTDAVLHNLAYIDFRCGRHADCIMRLAPHLEAFGKTGRELQQLWLRALHHLGELDRACAWAQQAEHAQVLHPQAAGVAALAALDASQLPLAQRWSHWALTQAADGQVVIEGLVAQGSLALAAKDVVRAGQLTNAALDLNATDGRTLSLRAFIDLMEGHLDVALAHFALALDSMPGHIGTWHGQGWTQLLQHDLDVAQTSFEAALALDRNFAESHGGLAVVLAMRKQVQAAQRHINLALKLDANNLSGRYAQALLSGEITDSATVQRLARRLLGSQAAPLGGKMSDWLDI